MSYLVSGKCLCGEIKFTGNTEVKRVANCHCKDCQQITGAAFATIIFVKEEEIEISGSPKVFFHHSDRGSKLEKRFCGNCGSPMFALNHTRPGILGLRAGALDQKELVKPVVNVYLDSKIKTTPLNEDLVSFQKMPE